jgi:hypothetical protein
VIVLEVEAGHDTKRMAWKTHAQPTVVYTSCPTSCSAVKTSVAYMLCPSRCSMTCVVTERVMLSNDGGDVRGLAGSAQQ